MELEEVPQWFPVSPMLPSSSSLAEGMTVCTDDDTRNNIRAAVCSMKDRDVCLKELDFRPFWPYREKGTWNLLDRRSKDIGRSAQRSVG